MFKAVVLAAGMSRRMGAADKLLLPFGKHTIVEQVLTVLKKVKQLEIVVVCHSAQVAAKAEKLGLPVVFPVGPVSQSNSLKAGIQKLPQDFKGVFFVLGDQPFIEADLCEKMQQAFLYLQQLGSSRDIILPYYNNQRKNPVLFSSSYCEKFTGIEGDQGAREIIEESLKNIFKLKLDDPNLTLDIDTPEDYQLALKALQNIKG